MTSEDEFKHIQICRYVLQRASMESKMKKGLQKQLKEMVHEDEPIKEFMIIMKEHMNMVEI